MVSQLESRKNALFK